MLRLGIAVALIAALAVATCPGQTRSGASQGVRYRVTILPSLVGLSGADATDIDAKGRVVGTAGSTQAFIATPSRGATLLPTLPGGSFSTAEAFGPQGLVVGSADGVAVPQHAVVWVPRSVTPL